MQRVEGALQPGGDSYDRAAHKCRTLLVHPFRLRRVENRLIPEEPLLHAARGLQLARLFFCDSIELLRNKVIWIPELSRARN